jgi:acetolactate synthase-1/2/3 large subunit
LIKGYAVDHIRQVTIAQKIVLIWRSFIYRKRVIKYRSFFVSLFDYFCITQKKVMIAEEYIARSLKSHGVRRFFGIPGGPSITYMEAFRKEGIEFILTSHEATAAMMADVTARLTGVTGVCHSTFGPGATNLSTGIGGALLDRSPLLALTSEVPAGWIGRTTQMNIDHQALFAPLTKATYRLAKENAREVIAEALSIANEEYPGPVHIGLPSDLSGAEVTDATEVKGSKIDCSEKDFKLDERVRVLLVSAKRPLIAVGLTAMRSKAGAGLRKLLDNCAVPVVVTPMAKGIIPDDHPSYGGVLFHALSDRLRRLTREADLIIGLGYDPVEYNYESWVHNVPLLHFDTRQTDLTIPGAMEIISSPARWFEALSMLRSSPEMMEIAGEVRSSIRNELSERIKGFSPATLIDILHDHLPDDTVMTVDVGSHLHLVGQMWNVREPGRLIMTNGWSSMGFGLPAAIAAALINRKSTVVCVTGDGGLLMYAGELMTVRRYGLKIITVVLADGELNLIRVKESWKNISPYGTELYSGTLFGADTFLGIEVWRVNDSDGMTSAITRALNNERSVIIEAAVDPSVYSSLIVRS